MDTQLIQKIKENLSINGAGEILNPELLGEELKDIHLLNLNALKEGVKELVGILQKMAPDISPTIHFSIADSFRIDAYAARLDPNDPKWNRHYLVSIYHGAFQNFFSLFWGLLAHPKILPDIGKPNIEIPSFLYNEGLIDYCYNFPEAKNQMKEFGRTWVTHFYPEDKDRQVYGQILANLCIEYLFLHEISHILGGHIDFLIEEQLSQGLFHFQPTALGAAAYDTSLGIPNIKVLEYEADLIAGSLIASVIKYDRSLLGSFLEDQLSSSIDLYKALAFALLILFHLFKEIRKSYKKVQPYPEPDIRFWAAYYGIVSHMRREYGEEGVKKFEDAFSWSIENYFRLITELKLPNQFVFINQENYQGFEEIQILEEALKVIDPLLYPHSLWRQANR